MPRVLAVSGYIHKFYLYVLTNFFGCCAQRLPGLVLAQEDLATQIMQKVGTLEFVHHGAFYFRQMELDATVDQALVDRFQTFQSRGVDQVDRRAHQYQMAQVRVACDLIIDQIFQVASVSEVEALVHSQGQDMLLGFNLVSIDVAEMFGSRNTTNDSAVRFAGTVEVQQHRKTNPGNNAQFDTLYQSEQYGCQHGGKVAARVGPGAFQCAQIHQ